MLALALAGCAGADGETEKPRSGITKERTAGKSTATEKPREASEKEPAETTAPPPPVPADIPLPGCEALIPPAIAADIMGSSAVQFGGQESSSERRISSQGYGPVAQQAFRSATETAHCSWLIPNSGGGFSFVVAKIPDGERDAFLAALRASDYVEGSVEGAPTFELYVDGLGWDGAAMPVQFAFVGPVVYTAIPPGIVIQPHVVSSLKAHGF